MHFRNRVMQRCGVFLSKSQIIAIGDLIRKGHYQFIEQQSNRIRVYRGCINDIEVNIVYDRIRRVPVTVMPIECKETEAETEAA